MAPVMCHSNSLRCPEFMTAGPFKGKLRDCIYTLDFKAEGPWGLLKNDLAQPCNS